MWPKYKLYLVHVVKRYGILNKCGQNNQIIIWGNDELESVKVCVQSVF